MKYRLLINGKKEKDFDDCFDLDDHAYNLIKKGNVVTAKVQAIKKGFFRDTVLHTETIFPVPESSIEDANNSQSAMEYYEQEYWDN